MNTSSSQSSVDGPSGASSDIKFNSRGEISVFPVPTGPVGYNEPRDGEEVGGGYEGDSLLDSPLSRNPSCFVSVHGNIIRSCSHL